MRTRRTRLLGLAVPVDGKAKRWGFGAIIVLAVIMPALSALLVFWASQTTRQRQAVATALRLCGDSAVVQIEGDRANNPTAVVAAVLGVQAGPGHHSSPTSPFSVDIVCSTDVIRLRLARDSKRADEYWVFLASGPVVVGEELGLITTHVFADVRK
jgi:hypothetical protein